MPVGRTGCVTPSGIVQIRFQKAPLIRQIENMEVSEGDRPWIFCRHWPNPDAPVRVRTVQRPPARMWSRSSPLAWSPGCLPALQHAFPSPPRARFEKRSRFRADDDRAPSHQVIFARDRSHQKLSFLRNSFSGETDIGGSYSRRVSVSRALIGPACAWTFSRHLGERIV